MLIEKWIAAEVVKCQNRQNNKKDVEKLHFEKVKKRSYKIS